MVGVAVQHEAAMSDEVCSVCMCADGVDVLEEKKAQQRQYKGRRVVEFCVGAKKKEKKKEKERTSKPGIDMMTTMLYSTPRNQNLRK